MAIYVLVGGTDVHALNYLVDDDGSFSIEKVLNRRARCSCRVEDFSGAYRPSELAEFVVWNEARSTNDAAITASGTTLTSASATFVAGDVGQTVEVFGADTGSQPLVTTIVSRTSATQVVLARAAVNTVSGAFLRVGKREFAGLVTSLDETDVGEAGGVRHALEADDYHQYFDRMILKLSVEAGQTMKQVVQAIATAANFSEFLITLDPAMPNGPTLTDIPLEFDYVSVTVAFAKLKELTGYLYNITTERVLRWRAPTFDTMPANITNTTAIKGSMQVRRAVHSRYRNRTHLRCGPTGTMGITDNLSGQITGSNRVFALTYPVATAPGSCVANGIYKPVGVYGVDTMEWTYRASDRSLVQDSGYGALQMGQTLAVDYAAGLPFTATATNGSQYAYRRRWEQVEKDETILTMAAAVAAVAQLNLRYSSTPRTAAWSFWTAGYEPGQTGTIVRSERGLGGEAFLITEVRIGIDAGMRLEYSVMAVEGSEFQGTWRDWYDTMTSGGGAGSVLGSGTVIGGGAAGGDTVIVQGGISRPYLGGSETTRTRVVSAGTYVPAKDGVEPILKSSLMPSVFSLDIKLKAPTGGTVTARVVAGSGDWSNAQPVGTGTACSSSTDWEWQYITITPRVGDYAYRVELTSNLSNVDVGFKGAQFRW